VISRRALLAGGVAAVACGRRKSTGFGGYAFVANEEGQAIAAVDLTAFAVIRHIRLNGDPTAVLSHPSLPSVYALTPQDGTLYEIEIDRLAVRRKASFGGEAVTARMFGKEPCLYVLCREPRALVAFAPETLALKWRVTLPEEPVDFDIDNDGNAAVSFGLAGKLGIIDARTRRLAVMDAGGPVGTTRFRPDGAILLTADQPRRMLLVHDVARRRLAVRLPLSLEPQNFCMSADRGQLFITGPGLDAVVIVYPYQTEVAETVLAGHSPGAMAASSTQPPYLFVANPGSGEVTILNVTNRRVIAVASVGADPGYITITPDNQYALVLNRKSGDLAVLLIRDNLANRQRYAGLFTMIPVGSKPVSAVVRAV
jgi:YVTN family beta-propeller protein